MRALHVPETSQCPRSWGRWGQSSGRTQQPRSRTAQIQAPTIIYRSINQSQSRSQTALNLAPTIIHQSINQDLKDQAN